MIREKIERWIRECVQRPPLVLPKTTDLRDELMKDLDERITHVEQGMSRGRLRIPLGPSVLCYEENNLRDQIIELRERVARLMKYMKVEEKTQPYRVYLQRRKK